MENDTICYNCEKIIKKYKDVYMCLDKTFCSLYCRNHILKYITTFDPDLNYPYKWNKNYENNVNKNDGFILLNYSINITIKDYDEHKKTNLYKSKSSYNLSIKDYKKQNQYTRSTKFNNFNSKITDKKLKYLMYICLSLILCNVIIDFM